MFADRTSQIKAKGIVEGKRLLASSSTWKSAGPGAIPAQSPCPLYPDEPTPSARSVTSGKCQQQTHASQQTPSSFDHLVGTASQSTETSNNPSVPLISFQSGS